MLTHRHLRYMLLVVLACAFSLSATWAHAQRRVAGQLYDLPLFANDLKPGERFYTFDHASTVTQKFGYDITGRRLDGDRWTSLKPGITSDAHWDDPKNTNYFVFGRPFYAMKDGTVIACWRRGPQNPRPKRPEESNDVPAAEKMWRHRWVRQQFLPGGGNHLWILHDDGTRVLYAHAQTDSIPSSLCPKTRRRFATKRDRNNDPVDENGMYHHIALTPSQRKRVKAGQFLGRIGNSGASTTPHLHIHVERKNSAGNWVAARMRFRRGMSTPWNSGSPDIDRWTSFSGRRITPGNVLFWPPTRLGREYVRHRAGSGSFGRVFKHLANSGFRPKIINGYSVGNRQYFNHVWVRARGPWRAHFGSNASAHQANANKNKRDGYAPIFADSYLRNGRVRYATIWMKGKPGRYQLRADMNRQQHQAVFNDAKSKRLNPISVSVVSRNGQRRFTALYRSDSMGAWSLRSAVRERDYQGLVNSENGKGRLPIYLDGYMHNGRPFYSVIFSSRYRGKTLARHKMSVSDYQGEAERAWSRGFSTQSVTAFDGARSQHRFGGVWIRQGPQRN